MWLLRNTQEPSCNWKGMICFTFPRGYYLMLLVDPSPHLFKLKISIPISNRTSPTFINQGLHSLGTLQCVKPFVPFLIGRTPQKYLLSLNSLSASPAKSKLRQHMAHTKLLCSNLGFPYLGDRPNSNANSNSEDVISLSNI